MVVSSEGERIFLESVSPGVVMCSVVSSAAAQNVCGRCRTSQCGYCSVH